MTDYFFYFYAGMETMKFIAVVENKQEIDRIAEALRNMGCTIERILKRTGVISGQSGSRSLRDLAIKGIRSVEPERNVKKL
ncbi:hypothetical protein [Flavihumibacter solisilvae]|jgi:hypothetical protein|uniref:DAHP synthase ferredoxin-like domain-containing protein n=1 Tax=Flavihumibacter solisilvae TaxID=1349421 RepID=A0A0C1L0E7_9BACT|nr:hypothetical protein [Flavihumibacter solisilvae]KIC93452.1 hypothetical protein OI18_16925 [Flavihumibacter solisilvae]